MMWSHSHLFLVGVEGAVHRSTRCTVRWGLGSGQGLQVGGESGERSLQRKKNPGYRTWRSSLPSPIYPSFTCIPFLMQLPCQPLKPLNVKCEAHLSFVSFFLVTPVLSGDKEFGLSLSQTCLLYSISQIPPFLSLCLCKATSLLKMPSTPSHFSRVSSCASSVKCHLLWEAFHLHRV